MRQFTLNNKEYNLIENWDELMLKQYIHFAKLEKQKSVIIGELYLIRLFEILCGADENELDDLDMKTYRELEVTSNFLLENPILNKNCHIILDGKDYWFERNLNENLTLGAYASARTLIENTPDELDVMSKLIAILLRPATKIDDKWKQEKFNAANLERDSKFLEDNLKAIDIIEHLNFFLSGKE